MLPQLEVLDSEDIKRSDRIIAMQNFFTIKDDIVQQQEAYKLKRMAQKKRLEKETEEKWRNEDADLDDEERTRRYYSVNLILIFLSIYFKECLFIQILE